MVTRMTVSLQSIAASLIAGLCLTLFLWFLPSVWARRLMMLIIFAFVCSSGLLVVSSISDVVARLAAPIAERLP